MTNKQIIDKVVEMHFKNEDWKGYLKKQIKERMKLRQAINKGIKNWEAQNKVII